MFILLFAQEIALRRNNVNTQCLRTTMLRPIWGAVHRSILSYFSCTFFPEVFKPLGEKTVDALTSDLTTVH